MDRTPIRYLIFGWTVSSDLECPELEKSFGVPELFFRFGGVPKTLPGALEESSVAQALPSTSLLQIDAIGGFLVKNGDQVIMEPAPGCSEDALRLFLLGPILGILLHQRRLFPIHGSAIASNGAVMFSGPSGSGKSTLALMFFQRGYRVLADELCAVDTSSTPHLLPAPPYLLLWEDSLSETGVATSGLRRARPELRKFVMPLNQTAAPNPVPLRICYILETSNGGEILVEPLEGIRKVEALARQTYRRTMLAPMDLVTKNFEQTCRLAAVTRVVRIHRPRGEFTASRLADVIERDFAA